MNHQAITTYIERIRETKPLIHNITNIVVANFTANGLLALGAKPIMANSIEEVAEITSISDALVLNMGTLHQQQLEAMLLAGRNANKHSIPIVLDPVGVGASLFRTSSAHKLLQQINITYIRGNAAEIANVIGKTEDIKGVETGTVRGDVVEIAKGAAQRLQTVIILTGKADIITDGTTTYKVYNGHPLLTKVTGTGCLLSAVIGAFASITTVNALQLAVAAVTYYGIAAELAVNKTSEQGPGSFQIEFLNQLSKVNDNTLQQLSSFERIGG